ncbi:MAG: NAD(P)-dependent oxidoreductase [Phycisphaerae bacterium]|nr:NAD(P)-dependent oxidoreductase [Phycisphaerae bacterium]
MRILLTGATGFLGAHLLRHLLSRGHTAAVLLRPHTDPWRIADQLPRVHRIDADLANAPAAESALADFAPETLIHLAWAGVINADRDDLRQLDNVTHTVELLKTANRAGVQHYIALGSQAEYGPANQRLDETHSTNPTTLYGASKLAACVLTRRLCDQFGLRFAWLRLFSAYGEMDNPAWMIPYLIMRLLKREEPELTAGTQLWDHIYAGDAAAAICAVAEQPAAAGIFNLGSGQARPLREIIEKLRDLVDPALPLGLGQVPFRPDQVMHLEANIDRLRACTGWSPAVSLADGLARTVNWYREHRSRYDN